MTISKQGSDKPFKGYTRSRACILDDSIWSHGSLRLYSFFFSLFLRLDNLCWFIFKCNSPFFLGSNQLLGPSSDFSQSDIILFNSNVSIWFFSFFPFLFLFWDPPSVHFSHILCQVLTYICNSFVKTWWLIPTPGSSLVIFLWTAFSLDCFFHIS